MWGGTLASIRFTYSLDRSEDKTKDRNLLIVILYYIFILYWKHVNNWISVIMTSPTVQWSIYCKHTARSCMILSVWICIYCIKKYNSTGYRIISVIQPTLYGQNKLYMQSIERVRLNPTKIMLNHTADTLWDNQILNSCPHYHHFTKLPLYVCYPVQFFVCVNLCVVYGEICPFPSVAVW